MHCVHLLFLQYVDERNRLGGEMLDQREETRQLATRAEQSKMEAKFREMQNELESAHKLECIELRNEFETQMVPLSFFTLFLALCLTHVVLSTPFHYMITFKHRTRRVNDGRKKRLLSSDTNNLFTNNEPSLWRWR